MSNLPQRSGRRTQLEGRWIEVDGYTLGASSEFIAGIYCEFIEDNYRWENTLLKCGSQWFKFHTNELTLPNEMDIIDSDDGLALRGIFRIEDDVLTLCFPEEENMERPNRFESSRETMWNLGIYRRV